MSLYAKRHYECPTCRCTEPIADAPTPLAAALEALARAERIKGMEAAKAACDWGDIYGDNAVRAIAAMIERERGK